MVSEEKRLVKSGAFTTLTPFIGSEPAAAAETLAQVTYVGLPSGLP